jgi:glyoxylate carboligase
MTIPVLAGSEYHCEVCNWAGEDPVLVPFGNPFASKNAAFSAFAAEFLAEFAKAASLPLVRVLMKWGFVHTDKAGKPSTLELTRYMKSMAGAMIIAMIEERQKMEKEVAVPNDRPVS